ncbi:MAG: DUF4468 domain-containing protein [Spirochaetaceae bacterium]|jgi:hypothetical protein|nr:DUF4468 domain-containing protein [Spirochaetaceae bacterium]
MKKSKFFGVAAVVATLVSAFLLAGCVSMPELSSSTKYDEIIEVPDISADDLFTKVNLWMVDQFNNADSVIQYSDKAAGVLKGKYSFSGDPIMGGLGGRLVYFSTLTIEVKSGKCRVSFADPVYDSYDGKGQKYASGAYLRTQSQVDEVIARWQELVGSLKQNLLSKGADW